MILKKIKKSFIVVLLLISCSKDTLRNEIKVYVYYKNNPLCNASIFTWQGHKKGYLKETATDSLGVLHLTEIVKYRIGMSPKNISQLFFVKKGNLVSDTFPTNQFTKKVYDTIFVKKVN